MDDPLVRRRRRTDVLAPAALATILVRHVGETTVKTHVAAILAKLGVRDRVHAVVFAYEAGIVRPGQL